MHPQLIYCKIADGTRVAQWVHHDAGEEVVWYCGV